MATQVELSFVSFEDQGTKAVKRLQRQHILRRQKEEKRASGQLPASNPAAKGNLKWKPSVQYQVDPSSGSVEKSTEKPPQKSTRPRVVEQQSRIKSFKLQTITEKEKKKNIVIAGPKTVNPPTSLKLLEHMFFSIRSHISFYVSCSVAKADGYMNTSTSRQPIGVKLIGSGHLSRYSNAIAAGIDALSNGRIAIAIPMINTGFELIEGSLRSDVYGFMLITTELLVMAVVLKTAEIAEMLLRQIYNMACVVFGKHNSYALWASRLAFMLKENPLDTLEAVLNAQAQAIESILGHENYHAMKWRSAAYRNIYAIRGHITLPEAFQEHLDAYSRLLPSTSDSDIVLSQRFLGEVAQLMAETGQDEKAINLLREVPKMVDKYEVEGGMNENSAKTLLFLLEQLGLTLTNQGKQHEAMGVWSKTASLSRRLNGANDPVTMTAMMFLTKSMEELGIKDNTSSIHSDDSLQKFSIERDLQTGFLEEIPDDVYDQD